MEKLTSVKIVRIRDNHNRIYVPKFLTEKFKSNSVKIKEVDSEIYVTGSTILDNITFNITTPSKGAARVIHYTTVNNIAGDYEYEFIENEETLILTKVNE